ncbi:MAG: AbrB/MazE/SpoVT family DNA-binding domain-containing protein [Bryobacteraceae bacterium]
MTTRIVIDKAGRVVIPKPLRDELELNPGDELQLQCDGDRITLCPVRPQVLLKKEMGVWVYQGRPTEASVTELIDREREKRLLDVIR